MFKETKVWEIIDYLWTQTSVTDLVAKANIYRWIPNEEPTVTFISIKESAPSDLLWNGVENRARIEVRVIWGNDTDQDSEISAIENVIKNVLLTTFEYWTFNIIRIYPVSGSPPLLTVDNRIERVTNYEFNFIN